MARRALADWNRLDPEDKRHLQREASDVRRCLFELAAVLGARLRDSDDKSLSWEDARDLALNPRADFVLARRIPGIVLHTRDIDEAGIGSRLGDPVPQVLESALAIAESDGFIEQCQPGRWRVTEFADEAFEECDDVALMEAAIVERLHRVGLAARDELAIGAGCPDAEEAGFLDALERALAAGTVQWLGPAMYGLPLEQLAAMDPPHDVALGAREGPKSLKDLAVDLTREVNQLRAAITGARAATGPSPASSSAGNRGVRARSRNLAAKAAAAGISALAGDGAVPGHAGADSGPRPAHGVRAQGKPRRKGDGEDDGEDTEPPAPIISHDRPAACGIGGCGVLAIGRCGTCGSAFCGTHQARSREGFRNVAYVDLCSLCQLQGAAATSAAFAERERVRKAGNDRDLLLRTVKMMAQHNVGGLMDRTFRWETKRMEHRVFRAPIQRRDVHEYVGAPAWPIGPLQGAEAHHPSVRSERIYRECGVTKLGAVVLMPAGITPHRLATIESARGFTAPMLDWVKHSDLPARVLDADLRSVKGPDPRRYKQAPTYSMDTGDLVQIAVRKLDTIATAHKFDLAHALDWPEDVRQAIRP